MLETTPRKTPRASKKIGDGIERLPDWEGECVAIVASGPTAKSAGVEKLKGRIHVVAINTSWELVPWAEMMYACDIGWWQLHRGGTAFPGLRVTQDIMACTMFPGSKLIRIEVNTADDVLLFKEFGSVATGGNGTFQAFNLMLQMGVAGIALIGCDMFGDHWHGRHPPPCTNPDERNLERWRKAFDDAAPVLAQRGVDVVNCSQMSRITAYPKMTIDQMLERWGL